MNGADPTPKRREGGEDNGFPLDQFLEDLADICVDLFLEQPPNTVAEPQPPSTKEPEE